MLTLHSYNKSFPKLFQKEKEELQKILGSQCVIEHIGSTAIPETDGKGVIDIMLIFNNKNEIDIAVKLLIKTGYSLSNNNTDRNERVFMSSAGTRESTLGDIHLHLTTKDNESYKNAILFRNYLINHPAIKLEYTNLKYQILKLVGQDRVRYTKMKKKFISRILKSATKPY